MRGKKTASWPRLLCSCLGALKKLGDRAFDSSEAAEFHVAALFNCSMSSSVWPTRYARILFVCYTTQDAGPLWYVDYLV